MTNETFELHVIPRPGNDYGLALYQTPPSAGGTNGHARQMRLVTQVWGLPLRAVGEHVFRAIRKGGHRTTELSRSRRDPFILDEDTGVRLGLLFLAVKPLHKTTRIESISAAVRGMASEEAYYWYSKCTSGRTARFAQRAFRVMIAGD
jgi:hypothetical protein